MQVSENGFTIDTDPDRLDIDYIQQQLAQSYWAEGVPRPVVERSIRGSLCFGMYDQQRQMGFARVITDKATFGYLADVFIDPAYRGRGLSKWLMQTIMSHPDLQGFRRFMLATRDAHGLYKSFGFEPLNNPERWMQIHHPGIYKRLPD